MYIFIQNNYTDHVSDQANDTVYRFSDYERFIEWAEFEYKDYMPDIFEYAYRIEDQEVKSISDNYGRTIVKI